MAGYGHKAEKQRSSSSVPTSGNATATAIVSECGGDCLPDFVESRRLSIIVSFTILLTLILIWILPPDNTSYGTNTAVTMNQASSNHHLHHQPSPHGHPQQEHDHIHIHSNQEDVHMVKHDKSITSSHSHQEGSSTGTSNNAHDDHQHTSSDSSHHSPLTIPENLFDTSLLLEPLNSDPVKHLLRVYKSEILSTTLGQYIHFNTSSSHVLYQTTIISSQTMQVTPSPMTIELKETAPCSKGRDSNLSDLAQIAVTPVIESLDKLYPDEFTDHKKTIRSWTMPTSREDIFPEALGRTRAPMLIIFTTCDQLSMTMLSLQYLKLHSAGADLLVIDDHSVDGTVEYLRKRGFAVITKPEATGLTDSWNIGYRMAIALGYEYVLFTNNDVLITSGSLELINEALKDHAMVLPMTTEKGAGHNPLQSILKLHKLPTALSPYTMDYRNAEAIQEALLTHRHIALNLTTLCNPQPSKFRNRPKFNGFSFAVNLKLIRSAAFDADINLFDPNDRMVGQEDHLAERMEKVNLIPMILPCVFFYHFKSVTVSSANITMFEELLKKEGYHNVTVQRRGTTPTMILTYNDTTIGHVYQKEIDVREDLHWYHVMTDSENSNDSNEDDVSDATQPHVEKTALKDSFIADLFTNLIQHRPSSPQITTAVMTASESSSLLSCLSSPAKPSKLPLFPSHKTSKASRLHHLYRDKYLQQMNWNIRESLATASNVCLYPSYWPDHCNRIVSSSNVASSVNAVGLSVFTPQLFAVNDGISSVIKDGVINHNLNGNNNIRDYTIGLAIPSSETTRGSSKKPTSKQDASTSLRTNMIRAIARDLSEDLLRHYRNVKVKFLHQENNAWYSIDHLFDVDLLLVFSAEYDLTRILPNFQDSTIGLTSPVDTRSFCPRPRQIKSTLLTLAWMSDQFDEWLTKRWLGHYDRLLTPSHRARAFFHTLSSTIGLPLSCVINCPRSINATVPVHFSSRFNVPVDLIDLPMTNDVLSGLPALAVSGSNHHLVEAQRIFSGLDFVIVMMNVQSSESTPSTGVDLHAINAVLKPLLDQHSGVTHKALYEKKGKVVIGTHRDPLATLKQTSHDHQHHHTTATHSNLRADHMDSSNSSGWEIELVSYEVIREACKYVKVLIEIQADKSNHDFASMSKLGLDCNLGVQDKQYVTNGHNQCLYVSNNMLTFDELIRESTSTSVHPTLPAGRQSLKTLPIKPVFSTIQELVKVLEYYLSEEDKRKHAVSFLREAVMRSRTGSGIVDVLTKTLGGKSLFVKANASYLATQVHDNIHKRRHTFQRQLSVAQSITTFNDTNPTVCIGIRTSPADHQALINLLQGLIAQYAALQKKHQSIMVPTKLKMFLVDTSSDADYAKQLMQLISSLKLMDSNRSNLSLDVMFDRQLIKSSSIAGAGEVSNGKAAKGNIVNVSGYKEFYLHDLTDRLLQVMLSFSDHCPRVDASASSNANKCDWIMLSDSTSQLQADWLESIAKTINGHSSHIGQNSDNIDLITWSLPHSSNNSNPVESHSGGNDVNNNPRTFHLSTTMFRPSLLRKSNVRFLSHSIFTKDFQLKNRESSFIQEVIKATNLPSDQIISYGY